MTTILDIFRQRGIKVLADGPELVLRAKKSLLTPELLAYAKVHKQQILILLRAEAASRMATGEAPAKLTLYVGRSGAQAWSRWPLDSRLWSPTELN
jgi:hypothetical protein